MKVVKNALAQIQKRAFAPIDIASLVFFRIAFGVVMVSEVWILRSQIAASWIYPRFLFKYSGFSWVQPWPGNGLYIHWYVMGAFAFFIAIGFFYRLNAALFCLSYTYFFLLDEGRYVNHAYLTALSIDLLAAPLLFWRRTRIPAFCLVVIFHLLNAQFFPIGIFPWLAITATTLFLSPSWPRRIISVFRAASPAKPKTSKLPVPKKPVLILSFVAAYTVIQIFVPLAHFFYPGGIEWTYLEHHFSWQMLLR
jgi:vitamin K-dependent gamma-carboxylase-like protein